MIYSIELIMHMMFGRKKITAFKPKPQMMIQCCQATRRYEQGFALKQVNFELPNGAMGFLIGHSGAGKSTLLKLMIQQEHLTSGYMQINQMTLSGRRSIKKIAQLRQSIGIILQNPQLLEKETVFYNVALPLLISGWPREKVQRRVRAALDKVNLLRKEKVSTQHLSVGEQHRVGIARAIINKPTLLIADEPTANLDPSLSFEIIKLLTAFNQMGVTVFIATHDLHLIPNNTKHIFVLENGCLKTGQEAATEEQSSVQR